MHVIATMPQGSEIERKNRAVVAFILLTGARDSAIASMKLKHIATYEPPLPRRTRVCFDTRTPCTPTLIEID